MENLKDWIERSDPNGIRIYDWILANLMRSADQGDVPEFVMESFVNDIKFDGSTVTFIFTDGREVEVKFENATGDDGGMMSPEDKKRLDSLWTNFGGRVVVSVIKEPNPEDPNEFIMKDRMTTFSIDPSKLSENNIPNEVAVANLLSDMVKDLFGKVTYTQKSSDEKVMEMKFYNTSDEVLATIELQKENFLSNVRKYEATEEDVQNGYAQSVGDPMLEFTMTDGSIFKIDLVSLVDTYSGGETDSIKVELVDQKIQANLKVSNSKGNVVISTLEDGIVAQLQMSNSNSIKLSNTEDGKLLADLIVDQAYNKDNQILLNVSENGLYSMVLWNNSGIVKLKYYKNSSDFVADKTSGNISDDGDICFIGDPLMIYAMGKYWDGTQNFVDAEVKKKINNIVDYMKDIYFRSTAEKTTAVISDYNPNTDSTSTRTIDLPMSDASQAGTMSADDFNKLSSIEDGAQVNVVTSVAGKVGDVSLNKTDVGLDQVDNTSDLDKPISTATKAALDLKADKKTTYTKNDVDDIIDKLDKYSVKLDQVDNTSDVNKPVSAAQQAALDLKSDKINTYTKADVNGIISQLDKYSVKLGNVDNTEDIEKPVSRPQQEALDTKADKENTYTKEEVDNKLSQSIQSLTWKETVATYDDIRTHYPDPEDGWTVNVMDTDITYRYDGTNWIPISANSIPLASQSVDGKMSKADKTKLDGINTDNVHSFSFSSNDSKVTVSMFRDTVIGTSEEAETFDFPVSTTALAGSMSANDKLRLERIVNINNQLSNTPESGNVTLKLTGTNINTNEPIEQTSVIESATKESAGVMSSSDKIKLDNITYVGTGVLGEVNGDTVTVKLNRINPANGVTDESSYIIPSATKSEAGIMSADDKIKLEDLNTSNINRRAIKSIKVGESIVSATSQEDIIEFVPGKDINIVAEVSDKRIIFEGTIAPKLLESSQDLNLLTNPGEYYTNDEVLSTILNKPVEENILIIVSGKSEGVLFQEAITKSSVSYIRTQKSGSIWNNWIKVDITEKADKSYVDETFVPYFNNKSILLDREGSLLGSKSAETEGTENVSIATIDNQGKVILGSVTSPITINSSDRPVINLSKDTSEEIAYKGEVDKVESKFDDIYTKNEVDEIVSKAHEHDVISVNGKVGEVVITKEDVGLSNVDNTSDVDKPISNLVQEALNLKSNIGDSYTKSESDNLYSLKSNTYTKEEVDNSISQVIANLDWKESVNTKSDLTIIYPNPEDGWTVNVKDTDITYRYSGTEWIEISSNSIPLASKDVDGKMSKGDKSKLDSIENGAQVNKVNSVSGKTGDVTLNKSDVGLSLVDNTSDLDKPISKLTKEALDSKADLEYVNSELDKKISESDVATPGSNGLMSAGDKAALDSMSGLNGVSITTIINPEPSDLKVPSERLFKSELDKYYTKVNIDERYGNVDNTSDLDKPVSTKTQEELDKKANIADIPTKLPNPEALTIKYNGVVTVTYDGSESKEGNFVINASTIPMSDSDDTTLEKKMETFQTASDVESMIQKVVGGAPEALDTLKELADALGGDANFVTTITNKINGKVDKEEGKGLSTNDFTNDNVAELSKLRTDIDYEGSRALEAEANINKELDRKVNWDESKKVISLPADGSISALRNSDTLEGGVLLAQRTYDSGATYVTEVGTTKNKTTINSSERPQIDISGGSKENVAYLSDIPKSLPSPNSLTVKYNGSEVFTYDGSEVKDVNLSVTASTIPGVTEDKTIEDDLNSITSRIEDIEQNTYSKTEIDSKLSDALERISSLESQLAQALSDIEALKSSIGA